MRDVKMTGDAVIDVTGDSWDVKVLKAPGLVAVGFWHQCCSWCCQGVPNLAIDGAAEVFRHG